MDSMHVNCIYPYNFIVLSSDAKVRPAQIFLLVLKEKKRVVAQGHFTVGFAFSLPLQGVGSRHRIGHEQISDFLEVNGRSFINLTRFKQLSCTVVF